MDTEKLICKIAAGARGYSFTVVGGKRISCIYVTPVSGVGRITAITMCHVLSVYSLGYGAVALLIIRVLRFLHRSLHPLIQSEVFYFEEVLRFLLAFPR